MKRFDKFFGFILLVSVTGSKILSISLIKSSWSWTNPDLKIKTYSEEIKEMRRITKRVNLLGFGELSRIFANGKEKPRQS